jgi:hypothetical protein
LAETPDTRQSGFPESISPGLVFADDQINELSAQGQYQNECTLL